MEGKRNINEYTDHSLITGLNPPPDDVKVDFHVFEK